MKNVDKSGYLQDMTAEGVVLKMPRERVSVVAEKKFIGASESHKVKRNVYNGCQKYIPLRSLPPSASMSFQ